MCGSFEIEKKSRDSAKLWKEWITNRILLFLHPRYYFKIHSKPNWYSHSDVSMRINWDELYGRYVCVRWWTGTFFFFFFSNAAWISPIRCRKWQMAVIFLRLIIYWFLWVSLSTALTPKISFIECRMRWLLHIIIFLSFQESLKCHCENLP